MERIIREATETEFQPGNMNRGEGFSLSRSWKPLIQTWRSGRTCDLLLYSVFLYTFSS